MRAPVRVVDAAGRRAYCARMDAHPTPDDPPDDLPADLPHDPPAGPTWADVDWLAERAQQTYAEGRDARSEVARRRASEWAARLLDIARRIAETLPPRA
jgi:hypothetical protein